ncbi:uncharacterized protein LOC121054483 [Oryza brachyantha]|uniref:uncharacterized protein LOC121054483 n=1 Tax=Oryza brachyantha TaxID=4533 RepID=UPI001ADCB8FD|nr:uncharacterized protein LOC121054483 [Oryza brachyantha]
MVAEAVAGWLVCPSIKLVLDKAKSFADERSGWLLGGGIREALDQLAGKLVHLRGVAATVERHGSRENGEHQQWLQQLKDAVFEADDVLDDFLYQQQQEATGASSPYLVKFAKRVFGSDESLNRLKLMAASSARCSRTTR